MTKFLNRQTSAILGIALLSSMFPFVPTRSWACSASGTVGFSHSSKTAGGAVTVCAKVTVESRTVAVSPAPKISPKPKATAPVPVKVVAPAPVKAVAKPPVKAAAKPALAFLFTTSTKSIPASLLKPVPKPAPKVITKAPAKVIPKPVASPFAVVTVSSSTSSGQATFTPAALSVLANPSQVSPGEAVLLSANPMAHYRYGTILEKATEVKFAPISTSWVFGDGTSGNGEVISHTYASAGMFEAIATTIYAVSYQITGTPNWVSSGQISVSARAVIAVSFAENVVEPAPAIRDAPESTSNSKMVRLVGKNCLSRSATYGC